jgi:hypothetical protein
MRDPISLRHIPPSALHMADCLCQQTNLSLADLLRQALVSGLLVEATRFAPAPDGTLGGKDPASLAKALRRHLGSAIDLLIEYGELPYQGKREADARPEQEQRPMPMDTEDPAAPEQDEEQNQVFENAIGEDLELLGIGVSLAATVENEKASPNPSV